MSFYNYVRLTDEGLKGYYDEGDGHISLFELSEFLDELKEKIESTKELKFLLDKYGENILVAWRKNFDFIKNLNNQILYAEEYEKNPKIQGTYYKTCYDNREKIKSELKLSEKLCSAIPARVLKYFGKNS